MLEQTIQETPRWKQALANLEEFRKMMELIRQYPIKPTERAPPCPPYEQGKKPYCWPLLD
ncbi:MAG: hypothetical protein V1725_01715 [archaeon]